MNYYRMYGLVIRSCVPLVNANKIRSQKHQLSIKKKNKLDTSGYVLFHEIFHKKDKVSSFYKKGKTFFIDMHGFGCFLLTNKQITLENNQNIGSQELAQVICNQIIPLVLQLNNYTSFHASAVEINDKAYLFVGQSGAGKSTLMGAFLKRNYKVISDDVSLVKVINKKAYVVPSFSQLRLTNKTLKNIFKKKTKASKGKKIITGVKYSKKPKLISRIFLLKKGTQIKVQSPKEATSFQFLPHFYRLDLEDAQKLSRELDLLRVITEQGLVRELLYPRDYKKLSQVVRAIKKA